MLDSPHVHIYELIYFLYALAAFSLGIFFFISFDFSSYFPMIFLFSTSIYFFSLLIPNLRSHVMDYLS